MPYLQRYGRDHVRKTTPTERAESQDLPRVLWHGRGRGSEDGQTDHHYL